MSELAESSNASLAELTRVSGRAAATALDMGLSILEQASSPREAALQMRDMADQCIALTRQLEAGRQDLAKD